MVPALELVRLEAATRLKSSPAEEAPETLTLPLSLMLTSPAALALRLATFVLRAVVDEPMLPAVEVMFKVGAVTVPTLPFVISALEVSETVLLADSVPSNAIAPEAFIVADPESVMLLLCVYELIPERSIEPIGVAVPVVVTAPAEVTVRLFPAPNVPNCSPLLPLFI